eukprot:487783_1
MEAKNSTKLSSPNPDTDKDNDCGGDNDNNNDNDYPNTDWIEQYNQEYGIPDSPYPPEFSANRNINLEQDVMKFPIRIKAREQELNIDWLYWYIAETTESKLDKQDVIAPLEITDPTPGYFTELDKEEFMKLLQTELDKDEFITDVQLHLEKHCQSKMYQSYTQKLNKSVGNEPKFDSKHFVPDLEIVHQTQGYNCDRYIEPEEGEESEYLTDNKEWWMEQQEESEYLTDNNEWWSQWQADR